METFLVTGGDGFIGSHLVERLLHDGARVRVLDNLVARNGANLDYLKTLDSGRLETVIDDIRDLSACRRACQGVDYVFHQAALGSVPRSIEDPLATHETNATGTLNMLLAAKEAGVKRFVWASSSSVYGDKGDEAKSETLPVSPISPYGASKTAGEDYAQVFYRTFGLATVSLRYFNVFGPRQDPEGDYAAVIPKFITAMLAGRRPVIYGDGRQSRDFTYVGNVVDGNLAAITAPEAPGKIINLANGDRHDLLDLVARLNRLIGQELEPIFAPPRPGDIVHSMADVSLARTILGYTARIDYDQGLAMTVESFR